MTFEINSNSHPQPNERLNAKIHVNHTTISKCFDIIIFNVFQDFQMIYLSLRWSQIPLKTTLPGGKCWKFNSEAINCVWNLFVFCFVLLCFAMYSVRLMLVQMRDKILKRAIIFVRRKSIWLICMRNDFSAFNFCIPIEWMPHKCHSDINQYWEQSMFSIQSIGNSELSSVLLSFALSLFLFLCIAKAICWFRVVRNI